MAGKLFIASPAYSASYCAEYVQSLVDTIKDCKDHDILTVYKQVNGMHWIDIARDVLAHIFLQTDCTHMLQIDADLGWDADAPRRMMERDKPIIGGTYPIKTDAMNYFPIKRGESFTTVDALPGGFLMVKREVIERMIDGKPRYECSTLEYGKLQVAPLFTRKMTDSGYIGEDYAFCERAIEAGFDIWLEPNINFSHVGIKSWNGNYLRI